MKKSLSKSLRTFYGVGDLAFSLMTSMEVYGFTFFLTNIAQFSLAVSTTILLITSTVDAIFSPIYGAIINGVKAMRWGRYRSWLLVGPPLVVLTYPLQFSKIGSELTAAVIICAAFIISHIIWNIGWVANVSLVSVLASNGEERSLLASRRGTWGAVSRFVVSYTTVPFGTLLGGIFGNPVLGFTLATAAVTVAMMLGYWSHFAMTKGYEETSEKKTKAQKAAAKTAEKVVEKDKATIGELLKNLFLNPPLMVLMLADFARYLSGFIMSGILAYYYTYVIQNMDYYPIFILVGGITGVVGAYMAAFLCKRFSNRTTVIVSFIVFAASMLVGKFVAYQAVLFIAVLGVAQLINGSLRSSVVALYADTVVYGEWRTGKNTAGFIMGLMNLPLKLSIIGRTVVIAATLSAAGFDSSIDPTLASEALKTGIINAFTLVPAIGMVISFLLLAFGYKLTHEKLTQCQKEIDDRVIDAPQA